MFGHGIRVIKNPKTKQNKTKKNNKYTYENIKKLDRSTPSCVSNPSLPKTKLKKHPYNYKQLKAFQ